MEGRSGVSRSILDELHSSEIQGDQMEGESGITQRIIDELDSSDLVKWKVKVMLLQVDLMNVIFGLSK